MTESPLAQFDALLKEVVTAKRLSGSKIQALTDMAKKLMKHDVHLVSSLYKTHRSLPPKSVQKVSSLYCFDALARNGAKSIVDKAAKLKTPESDKAAGYAGSFLLKVEGVLQGLTADMVGDGWTEGQEKMRKVLDIWTKGQTFPPATLARLQNQLQAAVAAGNSTASSSSTSRSHEKQPVKEQARSTTPDGYPTTPPPQPAAALPQLSSAPPTQPPPSAPPTTAPAAAPAIPALDPALLANLAQITAQAKMFPAFAPTPPSGQVSTPSAVAPPVPAPPAPVRPSHPSPHHSSSFGPATPGASVSISATQPSLDAAIAKRDEFARKMAGMLGGSSVPPPGGSGGGQPIPSYESAQPASSGPSVLDQPPRPAYNPSDARSPTSGVFPLPTDYGRPPPPPRPSSFDHRGAGPSRDQRFPGGRPPAAYPPPQPTGARGPSWQSPMHDDSSSQRSQYYDARSQPSSQQSDQRYATTGPSGLRNGRGGAPTPGKDEFGRDIVRTAQEGGRKGSADEVGGSAASGPPGEGGGGGGGEDEMEMEMEMDLESSSDEDALGGLGKRPGGGRGAQAPPPAKRPKTDRPVQIAVSSEAAERFAQVPVPAPPTSNGHPPAAQASTTTLPSGGAITLETFDMTTFDPTSADSWSALGVAWRNTNQGAEPTPQGLMMFIASKTAAMAGGGMGMNDGAGGGDHGAGEGWAAGQQQQAPMNDDTHHQVRGSWDDGPYADFGRSSRGRGR